MSRRVVMSVRFHRHPLGSTGCTIGLHPEFGVVGYGTNKADALHTAAAIAGELQSVLKEHPALAAALPPGTGLALTGLAAASKAIAEGHAPEDIAKALGPATAKLASRILSIF